MNLRPYQAAGLDSIRAAYARGAQRVLYVAPTGSGKTVCFSFIARNAAGKGNRVCIAVHRRELLKQTSEKLEHAHGRISAGLSAKRGELIQVASVQTLVNRLDAYQFDLIIIDEAHHATAGSWKKIINKYIDYMQSPMEDLIGLRQLNFLWTMGGNVSSAML